MYEEEIKKILCDFVNDIEAECKITITAKAICQLFAQDAKTASYHQAQLKEIKNQIEIRLESYLIMKWSEIDWWQSLWQRI